MDKSKVSMSFLVFGIVHVLSFTRRAYLCRRPERELYLGVGIDVMLAVRRVYIVGRHPPREHISLVPLPWPPTRQQLISRKLSYSQQTDSKI